VADVKNRVNRAVRRAESGAGQVVGRPRRAADQFGELHQRLRILLQQRQIGAASADRIEEIEAALPGRIGRRGGRRGVDQARAEGVEALAVARRQLQVAAAATEAVQAFDERLRLAETKRGRSRSRDSSLAVLPSQMPASG
jgi:hypothetical protein